MLLLRTYALRNLGEFCLAALFAAFARRRRSIRKRQPEGAGFIKRITVASKDGYATFPL